MTDLEKLEAAYLIIFGTFGFTICGALIIVLAELAFPGLIF